MLNLENLADWIKEDLLQRLGKDETDASVDHLIAAMTPEEAFEEWCSWHGLGSGEHILATIDNLRQSKSD
jgi:predicted metal-dependent HD superfamily phosphohydrolase